MLELGSCSVSSQSLTADHNALGRLGAPAGTESPGACLGIGEMCGSSTPRHHLLPSSKADCESWQKHRAGLARDSSTMFPGSRPIVEPQSLSTSYDTLYLPQMSGYAPPTHPSRLGLTLDVASTFEVAGGTLGVDGDLAVSPNVMKRRRGGLIEQRDIVKAHQAHKIHSTPQARRKEWEWVLTQNCSHSNYTESWDECLIHFCHQKWTLTAGVLNFSNFQTAPYTQRCYKTSACNSINLAPLKLYHLNVLWWN